MVVTFFHQKNIRLLNAMTVESPKCHKIPFQWHLKICRFVPTQNRIFIQLSQELHGYFWAHETNPWFFMLTVSTPQEPTWHPDVTCSFCLSGSCRWCQNHHWRWCHQSRLGMSFQSFGYPSLTGCTAPPVNEVMAIKNKEKIAQLHNSILLSVVCE